MSDVYLALVSSAIGVNKLLVVKQLRASMLDEPEALSMFMDEARLAARLHHPNVVQTFEVGHEGPIPFMTMEFLDGQPLHRVLRRIGARTAVEHGLQPLTLGMRLRIVTEMLEGLHYAHELRDYDGRAMQVVHRDVSPQNLFITYDGQIKLVDFGIAKASDSITRTETRGLKGKLAYMSPQQAAGERLDRRADVFAAGVMLWELLGGGRLWEEISGSEATIARRLVDRELPSLALDGIPDALLDIARRALAPAVEDRYPTAAGFRQALEQFMDDRGLDASSRAIGKRVAEAFTPERLEIRARIDQELLRLVGEGEDIGEPPTELWRDGYRASEQTERTLESGERERDSEANPDEITADYGPPLGDEPEPEPEPRRPPPREASGTIGELGSIAAPTQPGPRRRPWPTIGLGVLAAGLLGVLVFERLDGESRPEHERTGATPSTTDAPPPELSGSSPGLAAPAGCDAPPDQKPIVALSGEIDEDATLGCEHTYLLRYETRVAAGVTLTIAPGTTLLGDRETKGTLIIQPGGRLIAEGTRERPIVFTSARAPGERAPGDWGGVLLLGRAPINLRDAAGRPIRGHVEGLLGAARYGGDDPEDDSGVLRYVRIEYPGIELAPANEINGLTLAGVGRKTTIDHVQVLASSDDCFEFFGGTVDASHLVCDSPGDDALDFDHGYRGRIQFVLVRDRPLAGASADKPSNGIEIDNDPNGTLAQPRTRPVIWNATLCGVGGGRSPSHAILARRSAQASLHGLVIGGFDYALDRRDVQTELELVGLGLAGQLEADVDEPNDDAGFDELAWLRDPARATLTELPNFPGCTAPDTALLPSAAIVPAEGFAGPPDDGFFDPDAAWLGAFSGPDDDWTAGWAG